MPIVDTQIHFEAKFGLPMSVEIQEAGIEFVSRHGYQSVKQVEEFRGPVEVLVHDEAGVGVVTRPVPAHKTRLIFPLAIDLDLLLMPLTIFPQPCHHQVITFLGEKLWPVADDRDSIGRL